MKILVINGPNINFLGIREKEIYGELTYQDLVNTLENFARENEILLDIKQTNSEGEIIDLLQQAHFDKDLTAIILNAGGYTHTSIAIRDAVSAINKDVYEVHLTDPNKREFFRQISYLTDVCKKTFKGKGFLSYLEALNYIKENSRD